MPLEVTTDDGTIPFHTAERWHVDETGYLHLRNDNGPVATFNNISWKCVEKGAAATVQD